MVYWCECLMFVLWYVDDDGPPLEVCRCGHISGEHLDGARSCVGLVARLAAHRRPEGGGDE